MGHALMEHRNGLVVDACLTPADWHAESVAALHMIEPHADRPQASEAPLDAVCRSLLGHSGGARRDVSEHQCTPAI